MISGASLKTPLYNRILEDLPPKREEIIREIGAGPDPSIEPGFVKKPVVDGEALRVVGVDEDGDGVADPVFAGGKEMAPAGIPSSGARINDLDPAIVLIGPTGGLQLRDLAAHRCTPAYEFPVPELGENDSRPKDGA